MTFELSYNNWNLILNYCIISIPSYYITVYVFCKMLDIRLKLPQIVYVLISGFFVAFLFVNIRFINPPLSHTILYFVVPVLLCFLIKVHDCFFKTLVIGLVSVSFVMVIEVFSIILQGTAAWIIGFSPNDLMDSLSTKIIAAVLCVLFMTIKRFRRGFQFFKEDTHLGLGLALSAIVMMLKCVNLRDNQEKNFMFIVFIIGIIIAGFGLYLWIRRSITAHYRERLQLKSEEHYIPNQ